MFDAGGVAMLAVYGLAAAVALYVARAAYEYARDGDSIRGALEGSSEWYGALLGAVAGVVAVAFVGGVEVVSLFVEFVGGHALGFVAAALAGLAALLAEGVLSLSGGQVVGIAIALVGVAMLSSRWVEL